MKSLNRIRIGATLIGAALCVSACSDGEGNTPGGAGAAGGGGDAGGGGPGGGGPGGGGAANNGEFPAPEVGGTPETDALADAPARCDQPAYKWLKSPDLGRVTAHEAEGVYTKSLLETLLLASGITLPITLKYDVETHIVTYVTQDRGKEIEATALVAWPSNVPAEAAALPALAVLHGTSGFKDGCGPTADQELSPIAAALASSGYLVVVPDYIGLKATPPPTGFLHPYLVGQATAIASLDAARALGRLPAEIRTGGAKPGTKLVVVGGSQGGHAALWVDRLAPYYARELTLAAVAATVPPSDLVGQASLGLTTLRESTANMIAFYGASASWYGAGDKLAEVLLPPLDKDVPAALGASCDPGDLLAGKQALTELFQPDLLAAASGGTLKAFGLWGCMVTENGLTTTSVARINEKSASYGVLFVTGEADSLVDTPNERAAYKALCEAGMPLQYLECAGASHTDATSWALPTILKFAEARLAGEAFTSSCEVSAPVTCEGTPPP
jgi:pimeloyl-ACP methyl ester carboxylesterase